MNSVPIQTYKTILRHADGWQQYKSARLQVSVPPVPVYDPRMRSIMNWAVENFDRVTLCVHDSIQRYNIMATGVKPEEATHIAIQNGNEWLRKNIFPADVFVDVVRWDSMTAHAGFQKAKDRVAVLYTSNEGGFADAVNHDLNTFANRCRKRGEDFPISRIELSRQFLLEEISGYVPMFRDTSAVDIHTGMRMKAMQLLIDGVGNLGLKDNLMVTVKTFAPSDGIRSHSIKRQFGLGQ